MDTVEQIRLIEELAMNAWPAETIQIMDGWRLRFNHGITRRTNSVWPNEFGGRVPLEIRMRAVESFYERRGLPARFQITPAQLPQGLDDILEARGYTIHARTAVQTARTTDVLARTHSHLPVHIVEGADPDWFQAYAAAEAFDTLAAEVRWNTLRRTGPRDAYALLRANGQPVGVGRGVLERGRVGIFGMSTHPEHRRQGYATAVLHALARWASENGAEDMYLQVEMHNTGAQALYARAGFETLYHYYYRQKP
jgi:ribosomal protein S18 acetylase RimI-like enzyme